VPQTTLERETMEALGLKQPLVIPWVSLVQWLGWAAGTGLAILGALTLASLIPTIPQYRGIDIISFAFLVAVGPTVTFDIIYHSRQRGREERLPDFLGDVASLHKAGLTIQESVIQASKGDYGPLQPLVVQAADQIRWNIPFLAVIDNFRIHLASPIGDRALTAIREAGRTGGNLAEVMALTAENARAFAERRGDRRRSMGLYTIVLYVAGLVFIGIALAMQAVFVPRMIEAFAATAGSGGGFGGSVSGEVPKQTDFRNLFFVAALVQAVGSGIVGGIMTEGRVRTGLLHAAVLVAVTLLGFQFA